MPLVLTPSKINIILIYFLDFRFLPDIYLHMNCYLTCPPQAAAIILWLLLSVAIFSISCHRSAIAWIFFLASSSSLK